MCLGVRFFLKPPGDDLSDAVEHAQQSSWMRGAGSVRSSLSYRRRSFFGMPPPGVFVLPGGRGLMKAAAAAFHHSCTDQRVLEAISRSSNGRIGFVTAILIERPRPRHYGIVCVAQEMR